MYITAVEKPICLRIIVFIVVACCLGFILMCLGLLFTWVCCVKSAGTCFLLKWTFDHYTMEDDALVIVSLGIVGLKEWYVNLLQGRWMSKEQRQAWGMFCAWMKFVFVLTMRKLCGIFRLFLPLSRESSEATPSVGERERMLLHNSAGVRQYGNRMCTV